MLLKFLFYKERREQTGAPKATEKNMLEQSECRLLQTYRVRFVKKGTASTNVRNIRKIHLKRNFQGKENSEKQTSKLVKGGISVTVVWRNIISKPNVNQKDLYLKALQKLAPYFAA